MEIKELIENIYNRKIDIRCTNMNIMNIICKNLWPDYKGTIINKAYYIQSHDKHCFTFNNVPLNAYIISDVDLYKKLVINDLYNLEDLYSDIDQVQIIEF